MDIYDCYSPVDFRNRVPELAPYLSENSSIKYQSKVEGALAKVKARRGIISYDSVHEIENAASKITAAEVYAEEKKTGHNVIALVNRIKSYISDKAKPGVHTPATSYCIIDTANALRYRDAINDVVIWDMIDLLKTWIHMAREEKDTLQIGRTHLQHAEPITFGFAMAYYVSRFGGRTLRIREDVKNLRGKFSGAVGAYNASSLLVDDPEQFEIEVLGELGIKPIEISTQIVQPEPVVDLMHTITSSFGILANWADDMRNLERPEIAEIGQPRGGIDISRSSTMPHKANPVGLENIKSIYKYTMPTMSAIRKAANDDNEEAISFMETMYLDQISDHQRDLTNSGSQRFVPSIINLFDYSVRRANRVSKKLQPHRKNMRNNFEKSANVIVAEPLHILLSHYGYPNSHEHVGKLADEAIITGRLIFEIATEDRNLESYIKKFTSEQIDILSNPEKYIGIASQKTEKVCKNWTEQLNILQEELAAA